ncbi:SGNH/GDSL hydrolase family protein [Novosphingobium sp. MW5]|nr:SGNH/GDSL hydrolase family protein [Novosphingobium sp. MW5]
MRPLATAALAFALTGCATLHPALPHNARYVAMGSSYAAGTGINGIKPGTPQRCGRSASNYATLLAGKLGLALDDQTCGGATTAHILGPWNELPAQVEAVNAETRLVTVTIGGNDVNYVGNLYAASCSGEGFMVQGVKRPCPAMRPPKAEDYAKLEANLRAVAREVHRRAPKATLVFVQYVKLVPDNPCAESQLSAEGALINRDIGEQLAKVTARAAEAEGALVLPANELSRGHTLCDADRWSVGIKPGGPEAPASWHPTAAGHAAIANALASMLGRN